MWPPNFERWDTLVEGMVESIQIAVLSSAAGILLSLPLGLMAARNLSPWWLSAPTRGFVAICRSLHYVIVAILFVKAVGFGALAGIAALTVASMGFIAKLFAEAIEEISMKQVEAVRATGAGPFGVLLYGVLPQVASRFVGFCIYQLDSNLRNSTLVGIVGAGGIGGTLFAAFKRFDYDFVAAILLSIIALIFLAEIVSPACGARCNDRRTASRMDALHAGAAHRALAAVARHGRRLRLGRAHHRGDPRIPARRARADGRPANAHVAARPRPLPRGRACRAGRDTAHRHTRHGAVLHHGGAARAARRAQCLPDRAAELAGESVPGRLAQRERAGLGAAVRRHLRPGAMAGVLAIAFRSVGFVGKLLAEAIEETPRGPMEAMDAVGAPWGARMLKGLWPQVQPAFWGIALFRWDINVRESAVLGLVGAGGIGVALDDAINFFQWDRVATILLAILVVVILAEIAVTRIRRRLI